MIISIFCLIVGLFQKGFSFVSFIFNVYGVIFSVQAFPSWLIQSPSAVKESSLQNHAPVFCLWRQTRIFFFHTHVYLLAKGCISPLCRAWCCTIVFISTDACFLLKMFSKWCGGTLNCEWVIFWQASSWDAGYVGITAKILWPVLLLNFSRMILGLPRPFPGWGSMHENGNLPLRELHL